MRYRNAAETVTRSKRTRANSVGADMRTLAREMGKERAEAAKDAAKDRELVATLVQNATTEQTAGLGALFTQLSQDAAKQSREQHTEVIKELVESRSLETSHMQTIQFFMSNQVNLPAGSETGTCKFTSHNCARCLVSAR